MTETFDMSTAPPSPGAQLTFYGQAYIVEAVEPHTRKDGRPSAVIHWCTECASCKLALVRFTTGLIGRIQTRRCRPCVRTNPYWRKNLMGDPGGGGPLEPDPRPGRAWS